MKNLSYRLLYLLLLTIFFGSAENVFANRCPDMDACERYAATDLIFVAKYKYVSSAIQTEGRFLLEKYPNRFEVKEMFLGAEEDVKKVIYNSGGMKSQKLIDGETYLIYARKKDEDTFTTGSCSAYLLKYAEEDLNFLRNIPKHIVFSSVLSGLVETPRDVDIKDVKIKVERIDTDPHTVELSPDSEGKYQLHSLAKGKYKVTPFYLGQPIRNLYSTGDAFEIRGRGCYSIDFFLRKDKDGIFNF